ncbi:MAG: SMP-30/gluconolactonase/LRE family protein [Parafilimonas sp.]|nr:SMP-30/gluconolactonase/LRE family protein [Parafilimonas sp.]
MSFSLTPEIVLDHVCDLGEGPVWDEDSQSILWLDINKGQIHKYNIKTGRHNFFIVGEMVGCIAPRENGGFISGLENGIGFIDIERNVIEHIINPEEDLTNRFNDGKCDAAGRFWVGTMSKKEEANKGNLYVLETNLSVKKKIENVTISNGIAWNADNTVMYYINTPTKYIFAFDFNIETGEINNQRVVIDLTNESGHADGMTIDEEGMLWIAFYGGWRVARYDPYSGNILQQIELPVENATCCTFGGAGLTDLYITTASQNMSEELLKQQPHAGKLFVVKNCGAKGLLAKKFKG